MKKMWSHIHFLLFASYPVIFFYLTNSDEVKLEFIILPLLLTVVLAVAIFIVSLIFLRNTSKSALLSSLCTVCIFIIGKVAVEHEMRYPFLESNKIAILLAVLITVAVFLYSVKNKKKIQTVEHILLSVITPLFLFSLGNLAVVGMSKNTTATSYQSEKVQLKSTEKPDIYYFIFDRYANTHILDRYFEFDNSELLSFFEQQDFYVADLSFANYSKTFQSLASSLNFAHLESMNLDIESNNKNPVYDLIKDNAVVAALKQHGYTYYHFGDKWEPTRVNDLADYNINAFVHIEEEPGNQLVSIINKNEFASEYFHRSLFLPVFTQYGTETRTLEGTTENKIREALEYKFEKLEKVIESSEEPKFVFAHFLFPHEPYVLDENCDPLTHDLRQERSMDQNYLNQLQCSNKKIQDLVSQIQQSSDNQAIIIIQSDEGPFKPTALFKSGAMRKQLSPQAIQSHMMILNAYYFPDGQYDQLYRDITPINSFPVVFNTFFSTNLPMRPDASYLYRDTAKPYQFTEVNPQINMLIDEIVE